MNIHAIYHAEFEGLGFIEDWILRKGHTLHETMLFDHQPLPATDEFDWLIVMGGPMSVNEEDRHAWLKDEKELIRKARLENKTILGICLGAQLIASSLGGKVYKNLYKEIGWFPVTFFGNKVNPRLSEILPRELTVFHWHGDTFDVPPGALSIASSEATLNQGFIIDNKIIGLQFHLEMKSENIGMICNACSDELIQGAFIQGYKKIMQTNHYFLAANRAMDNLLEYLEAETRNPE